MKIKEENVNKIWDDRVRELSARIGDCSPDKMKVGIDLIRDKRIKAQFQKLSKDLEYFIINREQIKAAKKRIQALEEKEINALYTWSQNLDETTWNIISKALLTNLTLFNFKNTKGIAKTILKSYFESKFRFFSTTVQNWSTQLKVKFLPYIKQLVQDQILRESIDIDCESCMCPMIEQSDGNLVCSGCDNELDRSEIFNPNYSYTQGPQWKSFLKRMN